MSIYGNIILGSQNPNTEPSILENYIDKYFLESVLNEASLSSTIQSEIKALTEKEKITEQDIKDIYKKIADVEDKKQQRKLIISLVSTITGVVTSYASIAFTYSNPGTALKMNAGALALVLFGSALAGDPSLDKFYYKIMELEAKAKKAKNKAEKLDDKDSVKANQQIIDICEKLKTERKDALRKKATGIQESVQEDDYLIEYKGNDIKNDIFVQVLEDVDDICKMNMDKIKTYEESIQKMISLAKSSTEKNIKDNLVKSRKIGRETNDNISKIKGYYGPLTFSMIKTEVKKFNNKYSYVSMTEKKKLADKLEAYKKKLADYSEKYKVGGKLDKEYIPILDKLESLDVSARKEFADLINSWLDAINYEINATIGDIDYVLKLMNIEKIEKNVVYKIMNVGKK